jgi:hypothetical protein
MKRLITVVSVVACIAIAGAPSGAEARGAHQSASRTYVAGGVGHFADQENTGISVQDTVGAVTFDGVSARSISVSIVDRSGQAVMAVVSQGDAGIAEICGASEKPVKVQPNTEIHVWLFNGQCGGGNSIVTTGTVTITSGRS